MNSWLRNVYSIMGADLKEFYRVKLIIISSCLMPVLMTVSFGLGTNYQEMANVKNYFMFIFPAILALGTMFSSIFSGGYVIILDRQQSTIRDLIISPVSYSTYITARILASVIKASPQLIISFALALPFMESFHVPHPLSIIAAFVLTSLLFTTVGMIIGSFSNVVTFPGLANIVLMPSMFLSDVFFPIANFKQFAAVVKLFPLTNSVKLFRYGFIGEGSVGDIMIGLSLLALSSAVVIVFWTWLFRKRVLED